MATSWDPFESPDWDKEAPSATCLIRIKRELAVMEQEESTGIYIYSNPDDMTKLQALIVGPEGTPYHGGFFLFQVRFPPNYPWQPPRVRFMTTGNGSVRFNPNFYSNGKVCLSILGTWTGPKWTPGQTLRCVLMSIQSLMGENPYHNEPGYEGSSSTEALRIYNQMILHDTLRVAVCEMMEKPDVPKQFIPVMEKSFLNHYDFFVETCKKNVKLNSKPVKDTLYATPSCGTYRYVAILSRLEAIKKKLS